MQINCKYPDPVEYVAVQLSGALEWAAEYISDIYVISSDQNSRMSISSQHI